MKIENKVRKCPFPDCDWEDWYDAENYGDQIASEEEAEKHYDRVHAGLAEVQITFTRQQIIGPGNLADVRAGYVDAHKDGETLPGWDFAHVRTEVIEEPDDHSVLEDSE